MAVSLRGRWAPRWAVAGPLGNNTGCIAVWGQGCSSWVLPCSEWVDSTHVLCWHTAVRMHFIRAGEQGCGYFWLQESHQAMRRDNHEECDGGEQASSPTPPLPSCPLPSLAMHFEWMMMWFRLWLQLSGSTG